MIPVDIVQLISQDLTVIKQSDEIYTTVEHDSLKIWKSTNSFYHFSANVGGGPIEWMIYWHRLEYSEAVEYLETQPLKKIDPSNFFKKDYIDSGLEPRMYFGKKEYHTYIANRNISKETADYFNLEVNGKWILIPIYDFDEKRIGCVLRNTDINSDIRYRKMITKNIPMLWPIQTWKECYPDNIVLIFEGAWSVMRFWQVNKNPVFKFLCLFGVVINQELLQYLNGLNNVVFVLDHDNAGRQMGKQLRLINNKWKLMMPKVYPDEMTDEQISNFLQYIITKGFHDEQKLSKIYGNV